jgi:AraC-like DNA-binding protein
MPTAGSLSELEDAVAAVESVCGLRICIHDLCGRLAMQFPPERGWHGSAACSVAKLGPHAARCVAFEVTELRPHLGRWARGRIHRCHAGFIEWMMPVFDPAHRPLAVLFAGQRRATAWLPEVAQPLSPAARLASGAAAVAIAPVDRASAEAYLEILRLLAMRLSAWVAGTGRGGSLPRSRAARISDFLDRYHHEDATLGRLARELGMSESRLSHVVRAETGCSWRSLLNDRRLRTACRLLKDTECSVGEVALRSGFGDQSHFQRLFKARMGMSPRRWRLGHPPLARLS